MMRLRNAFFIPFFYAIFPLLFLFSHNIEQTSFERFLLPFFITVSAAGIVFVGLFFALRKDIAKAALLTALLFFLFFSFGHIRNALEGVTAFDIAIGRDRYVIFGLGAIMCAAFVALSALRGHIEYLTRLFFIFGMILLAIPLISLARFEFSKFSDEDGGVFSSTMLNTNKTDLLPYQPDIYYIILDGYAHESTLRYIYNFDNTVFLSRLRERGFFIPAGSRANYAQTHLSLASSLNMDYLPPFSEDSAPRETTHPLIRQNAVTDFLRGQGYRFVHIGSGMVEMTDRNPYADLDFRNGRLDEFTMLALESSALYPFVRTHIEAEERKRVLYSFETLAKMPRLAGPKFIFSHILVPHPPFVFGPEGERIDDPELRLYEKNPWVLKDHYRNQLRFTNKKTLETIDAILDQSKNSPIIIIQGDHGTASTGEGYKGLEDPIDILAKERMKIFAAYYLPKTRGIIPDEITPINAFRRIFNAYFNAGFNLLPDKSYFSSYERPFVLTDVTDKARNDY